MNRKAFFSIYILLFSIFGGVLHGPYMAYASHLESMGSDMEKQSAHNAHQQRPDQQMKMLGGSGNSLMPCCDNSAIYAESEVAFRTLESEVLNLGHSSIENENIFLDETKSADADLSYKYFSPPEEIILSSVIKIE